MTNGINWQSESDPISIANVIFFTAIQREEEKVKRSLKDAAKKGDKDVCKILAKEVVHSHKAINKINAAKAKIKSVEYSMNQQLGGSQIS